MVEMDNWTRRHDRIRILIWKPTGTGLESLSSNPKSESFFLTSPISYVRSQRCAGSGVQESTPAGVSVFQPEQDQEWTFLIGTGTGAGVIFFTVLLRYMSICTLCNL